MKRARFTPFLVVLVLLPDAGVFAQQDRSIAPFRVAIVRFQHETCTFCPGGDTEIEHWTRIRPPLRGRELFASAARTRAASGGASGAANTAD